MRISALFVLLLATLAGGCVVSKAPVSGLGERVLPLPSGTALEIFERAGANAPWKAGEQKTVTLVAGADNIYRALNDAGKPEEDGIVFYPLAKDHYLVEAQFSENRYGYAVLRVENGEGLLSPLDCKAIPADTLKQSGMKMVADDCWLEDTNNPSEFLKSITATAPAASVKYVPAKAQ